uniref:Uncharacterized protein n=1 Tax=Alexandrium catenella TaxID=2925 RepID=A0A7S1RI18_ALECA|mmetsp:Transcript_59481/g.159312  ORF Transcript_59481/g.159312 Transcript_59481/m.159312 type:complete len:412 (-) Transcript_59481:59-1294(-)|eukprot:CAMPEP_0171163910 /NCGR_PEP_ID=MMETSP0790-20130122/5392_1 /TAXON_ID=2925 /ORGANISM="Alexandrium catenella, Strain OF101" /LENGTH=411 /DNA_ID=CAMNT_0011628641 /DNA_START=57 /DNA_END=1292 /DNA_ORIENTATION=+
MPSRVKRSNLNKAELDAAVKRIDGQLEHARANRAKLEERTREYDELQGMLETLPEKVAHPIMVPLGPLAFFEGYIEHTNEVLTQLSSEWFALRTTKSALEMVGRRRERLQQDQADVVREERELQMRRRVAVEAGASGSRTPAAATGTGGGVPDAPEGATVRRDEEGFLDIREPCLDDDNDAAGPLRAVPTPTPSQPKVLGPASAPATASRAPTSSPESGEASGAVHAVAEGAQAPAVEGGGDMLSRLKELERLEELQELEDLDKLEELGDEGGDAGVLQAPNDIGQQESAPVATVKSPADLFRMMSEVEAGASSGVGVTGPAEPSAPPSKADRREGTDVAASSSPVGDVPPGAREAGFAHGIVERVGGASALPGSTPPLSGSSASAPSADAGTAAPKRVSKFKSDRQRGRD